MDTKKPFNEWSDHEIQAWIQSRNVVYSVNDALAELDRRGRREQERESREHEKAFDTGWNGNER